MYHPPHPYMLNLCDRYGLVVLEEIPVVRVPAEILTRDPFIDLATTSANEMISRDIHHPSILAWGIGDEFESSQADARKFVEAVTAEMRSLDSRPVYYATRTPVHDSCTSLVDFVLLDPGSGDSKDFKAELQRWSAFHPSMPSIVGQVGTEVQDGNRNGYSDPLSYDAQSKFFLTRLEAVSGLNYDGAFALSFNDWKGDRPSLIIHSGDPWIYTMGLVSAARERRPAYDAVRSQFRKEKYVALPMGTYSKDAPIFFVLAGLVVLVTVAYLYNASRRFRDNLTRSISNSYNFFSDIRDQHSVSVLHSTLLGLLVSVAFGIVAESILFHFRSSWILDDLLSYLLVFDNFKQTVVEIIWDPLSAILYASSVTFVLMVAEAIVILLVAPLLRSRMYLYHSYTIVMWSASPLVVLIPIGMILYRIMESPAYVAPAVVIPALLVLWSFLRAMKGIAIVTDNLRAKVYALGVLSAVVVCTACFVYLDHRESIMTYLTYLYNAATLS
jgi:hypothetical protein